MNRNKYSRLFKLTFKFIKYFFLVLIGFYIAFVLAAGVGILGIAAQFFPLIFAGIWRIGIILLCLIATTMIIESLR
jgi:hypothetical protein